MDRLTGVGSQHGGWPAVDIVQLLYRCHTSIIHKGENAQMVEFYLFNTFCFTCTALHTVVTLKMCTEGLSIS